MVVGAQRAILAVVLRVDGHNWGELVIACTHCTYSSVESRSKRSSSTGLADVITGFIVGSGTLTVVLVVTGLQAL